MTVAFEFMMIGIMAGATGFVNMTATLKHSKKIRQLNERTNTIFRDMADKYGIEGTVLEPFCIAPVLKSGAIWGMMAGVPVALGIYDIVAVLIAILRRNQLAPTYHQSILYTALELIGGGSWPIGVLCLAVIAAGVAWAVLWEEAEKDLYILHGAAIYDLHSAQDRKWLSECDEV